MKNYDRSWPVALIAIVLGVAAGVMTLGLPSPEVGEHDHPLIDPRDGIRGLPAPPARPLAPPRYRPPRVLSNSGTYKALEALRSPRPEIRASGAGILSLSSEPERALPALIGALEGDEDAHVRLVAAQSIGRLGSEDGLAPLMRAAASDPSPRVRSMAVEAHDSLMARIPVERRGNR